MSEPIFKAMFGKTWESLPPAMKCRYDVAPLMGERVRMNGQLTISMARPIRMLAPLMRLTGLLIPVVGKFPTTVDFETYTQNPQTRLTRYVQTPSRKIIFKSEWIKRGDEIVEILGYFCGWRAHYSWDGTQIHLTHQGYALKLGRFIINLPLSWLFGQGNAIETPRSDDHFDMRMTITHRLWGEIYRYEGEFTLEPDNE